MDYTYKDESSIELKNNNFHIFINYQHHRITMIYIYVCICMYLSQGLFRNYGPSLLPLLRPHIERLSADPAEASQRCAAEMVAGGWGGEEVGVVNLKIIST